MEPPLELNADFSAEPALASIHQRLETRDIPIITHQYLSDLRTQLVQIVSVEQETLAGPTTAVPQFQVDSEPQELLRDIQFLLASFFNASVVLLQPI